MILVGVADVVPLKGVDEKIHFILVLLDEAQQRFLDIWIGPQQAEPMIAFMNEFVGRPTTYDFMASLLRASSAQLEAVEIVLLKENTYYATARLRCDDAIQEIDCRPSDAINLALVLGSPIYVADEVMDNAALVVPEELRPVQMHRAIEAWLKQRDTIQQQTAAEPPMTEEELATWKKSHHEKLENLLAFLTEDTEA